MFSEAANSLQPMAFPSALATDSGGTNTNVELLSPSIRGGIATVQRKYPNLTEEALR
jgi:hypothetical protein